MEETKSFYKVHTLTKTWDNAKRRCALEGARFWYPEDQSEADAVLGYMNETQPTFNAIFVGISSKLAKGVFKTIDGKHFTKFNYIFSILILTGKMLKISRNFKVIILYACYIDLSADRYSNYKF